MGQQRTSATEAASPRDRPPPRRPRGARGALGAPGRPGGRSGSSRGAREWSGAVGARWCPALPALVGLAGLLSAAAGHAASDPVATQVESDSITPGDFVVTGASCEAGEVPVGGGTGPEDITFVRLTEVAPGFGDSPAFFADEGPGPAPDVWFSSAVNGELGQENVQRTGAVCVPDDVPTSSVVERESVSADSFGTRVATCPSGSVAVGGGPSPADVADVRVTKTAPRLEDRLLDTDPGQASAPTGWSSAVRNLDDVEHDWVAVAVCQERSDVFTVIAEETVDPGPGATESVRVDCPTGALAIGGGVDPANVKDMFITGSEPVVGGQPLFFVEDGRRAAPTAWIGHVRNDTEFQQSVAVGVVCVPEPGARPLAAAALASLAALQRRARARRRRLGA